MKEDATHTLLAGAAISRARDRQRGFRIHGATHTAGGQYRASLGEWLVRAAAQPAGRQGDDLLIASGARSREAYVQARHRIVIPASPRCSTRLDRCGGSSAVAGSLASLADLHNEWCRRSS